MLFSKKQDKFREECGVFAIWKSNYSKLGHIFYPALISLQHRGEESSGISYLTTEGIKTKKTSGIVSNLFYKDEFYNVEYFSAIGHVRYSTSGDDSIQNAQPLEEKTSQGVIALAHNGNLLNFLNIKHDLKEKGYKFKTNSDSEIILKLITEKIEEGNEIEFAVENAIENLEGAFSVVVLTENKIIGFRDKKGIRPLCIGKIEENYVLSSESSSLNTLGGEYIRDVSPGEIVVIDENGVKSIKNYSYGANHLCALEYIYFSRPDSVIDGINLAKFRIECGEKLYKQYKVDCDVVMGVPESGNFAAMGYSKASKIPYEIGIVKNNYVGRNFIKATEKERKKHIDIKLSVISHIVRDKKILVIDDSIVRGTSSKKIVQALKKAGAKEVHFMVASPRIKYHCNLGIDIKTKKELLSFKKTKEEMREFIGADTLEFLSLEGIKECLKGSSVCTGCFNGDYADN